MKKTILIIILIVTLPFIGLLAFVKMVDVNQYVPSVAKEVKKSTGRELTVEQTTLDFSFTQGLLLNMDGVRLSDDPLFSQQSCLMIKRFALGVDLWAFLLDKRIKLTQMNIIEPQIQIIRREDGAINFAKMSAGETKPEGQQTKNISEKESAPMMPFDVFIDKIFIHQGQIHYLDQTFPVALDIPIRGVNLSVQDFSLSTTFSYEMTAKVFSDIENFSLKGKVSLDLSKLSAWAQDIQVQMNLQSMGIQQLESALPMIQDLSLQSLKGQMMFYGNTLKMNQKGLESFQGEVFIKEGFVLSKLFPLALESVEAKVTVNENSMTIDSLSGSMAKGRIFLRGLAKQEKKMTSVAFNCDMEDIEMSSIFQAYHLPVDMTGQLKGTAEGSFAGTTPDEMMVSLRGKGDFLLSKGKLQGANLLESLFQKIPFLSNILQIIAQDLPDEAQQSLTQGVSAIQGGKATWTIEGRAITLNQGWVDTDTLTIDSRGVVMMPGRVDIQADVYLEKELSQVMVRKASDVQNLLVEDRVYIPTYITGEAHSLKIQPDLQYLTQKLLIGGKSQQLISDIVEHPKVQKIFNSLFGSH